MSLSRGQIVGDVRRVARLLGHSPSSVEYARLGRYDVRTLQRKFRHAWGEIVASCGLLYTPRTCRRIACTRELSEDVARVARQVGHAPTRAEYESLGRFGADAVRRRSGRRKWEEAVSALAGLDPEEVKMYRRRGGVRYRTTAELLGRLRRLADELGRAPTTGEAGRAGLNAHDLRLRVGGGWQQVLEAAGVEARLVGRRGAPAEAIVEDVAGVARRLGRVPTAREYERRGRYTYAAVRARLGGWKAVKRIIAGGR